MRHVYRRLGWRATREVFVRKIPLELQNVENIVGTRMKRQVNLICIVTNKLSICEGASKLLQIKLGLRVRPTQTRFQVPV